MSLSDQVDGRALWIALGAIAIVILVPVGMAVTSGDHEVCDTAAEHFSSGAFITAVNSRSDAGKPAPQVCVTFPAWFSDKESRSVEVSVGHTSYDRRATLLFDLQTPGTTSGGAGSKVGGKRDGASTTIRSISIRPNYDFASTPGVRLRPQPPPEEARLSIVLHNDKHGVLYSAELGADVRTGLDVVFGRLRIALLPTVALLVFYLAVAYRVMTTRTFVDDGGTEPGTAPASAGARRGGVPTE